MSEEQLGPTAIDRLTGQPFRAEPLTRPWTLEELESKAREMGKPFTPSQETLLRLETDLTSDALVLFNDEEVSQAIQEGLIPPEWETDLIDLVEEKNDIAIIPKGAVEQWRERQKMQDLVIGRRRKGWSH